MLDFEQILGVPEQKIQISRIKAAMNLIAHNLDTFSKHETINFSKTKEKE